MTDHRVYFGEGSQTIRTVPLRGASRPYLVGSGTYEIHDLRYPEDSDSRILASGNVIVDSVSTTLSAAAGRAPGVTDPRALTVASATGIVVGRCYLLRQSGRDELVEVDGISGTTIRLRAAVTQPFPSGSSLLGIECSCSVPAEVTADDVYLGEDNLGVRWELGDLPPLLEPVFLERHVTAPIITRSDVLALDRTLESHDGLGLGIDLAIAQAQSDLAIDILSAGHNDSRVMAGPIGRECLKYAAAYHALKHAMGESEVRRAEHYKQRAADLRTNLLVGLDKAKVTHLDAEGAKKPKDYKSLFAVAW